MGKNTKYQTKSLIVPEYILPCPFTPTLDPQTQSQALSTHPRPTYTSHLDQFQYPFTHLKPFLPIPIRNHTSDALHTHQSLQYPSQTLHTHLKPLTPIAGPPHPTKALTPISGPPYLSLASYSLALYIQPRPTNPVPGCQNLNPEMVITANFSFRNMLNGAK